jgi:hypothetical protein
MAKICPKSAPIAGRSGAQALGLETTIYDPGLDPDRSPLGLVSLLENVLLGVRSLNGRAA